MARPIEIIVGGAGQYDPAIGDTDCVHPAIIGDFFVMSSGYGPLPYNSYEALSPGFRLLNGATFTEGETFYVQVFGVAESPGTSSYTNGLNMTRVVTALMNRIGFRQPTSTAYSSLVSSDNQISLSGRYFDDFHSVVSALNLKDTVDDAAMTDNQFNAYLQSLKKSVIMRSLTGCFNVAEQIERTLLFNRLGENDTLIENEGNFIGFKIRVPNEDNISIQLESVSLLFNADATFRLYLFKDGKKTPVWSSEVSVVGEEATVVSLSNLVLNYIGQATRGSIFYFGYFQNDLGSVKAIREQYECWNKQLCFSAMPMISKATGSDFNRSEISVSYDTNGMNLEISSFRDHTNSVIKKAHLFDELIGLQMAYNVIEGVIYSNRSNGKERILKDNVTSVGLQLDLTGSAAISDGPVTTGLKQRIDREIMRVKESFYPKAKSQVVNIC